MCNYELEKWIFTEADFEKMRWHDCMIYGLSFDKDNYKLLLDIDYIFSWVDSEDKKYYKFWVAPATLVFENVHNLQLELDCSLMKMEIDALRREEPKKPNNSIYIKKDIEWKWVFDTQEGEMSFWSIGYKQYIRRTPVLLDSQCFNLKQRGGVCFSLNKEG